MADPVIGATAQVFLEKLITITAVEVHRFMDYKNDVEKLTNTARMIKAFIHDAERRHIENQSVHQWLKRLEKVVEDAEYVFDEIRYESIKREVIPEKPMKKVGNLISHQVFKRMMSRKIKNINQELSDINKLAKELGLQVLGGPTPQRIPVRETDSFVVTSDVVGRDKDIAEIKEKILREDVVLLTIPIVGMGGLGKTTVAKRIFNDEDIKQNFEKRVWLCLPDMSEENKNFLRLILESLTARKLEVDSRDVIVKKLQEEFGGKSYLLVLDDLWKINLTVWHDFTETLKRINTSRRNFILVTTRSYHVASSVRC